MIKIGVCGFPTARKKLYETIQVIEVQKSFYDPGKIDTYHRWRAEAPDYVEFTVKAWQGLTHEIISPTWRRYKGELPGEPKNYGALKFTSETRYAVDKTVEICKALNSDKMVVQLPPRLEWRDYMEETLEYLFNTGLRICLEPRNKSWFTEEVKEVLRKYRIVFVTDPFKDGVVDINDELMYLRLHGIGGYKYRYSDDDLMTLLNSVKPISEEKDVYILFNNVYMYQDALRFKELLNRT